MGSLELWPSRQWEFGKRETLCKYFLLNVWRIPLGGQGQLELLDIGKTKPTNVQEWDFFFFFACRSTRWKYPEHQQLNTPKRLHTSWRRFSLFIFLVNHPSSPPGWKPSRLSSCGVRVIFTTRTEGDFYCRSIKEKGKKKIRPFCRHLHALCTPSLRRNVLLWREPQLTRCNATL